MKLTMTVDRDVVIDLLPVYFSGEASAATRALVEECFRQDPDLERIARSANKSVELLKVAPVTPQDWEEKQALEKARVRAEAFYASGLMGFLYTVMIMIFQVRDHKIVFLMWDKSPVIGMAFTAVAFIMWLTFWRMRTRFVLLPRTFHFGAWASFLSLLAVAIPAVFWLATKDQTVTPPTSSKPWAIVAIVAIVAWVAYFRELWKKRNNKP